MSVPAEGHHVWHIPDCYLPAVGDRANPSHEAFAILNTSQRAASVTATLYFATAEPWSFDLVVQPARTDRVRTDLPQHMGGHVVPRQTPYAARIASDEPITVQYSRLDSSTGYTLMTTAAIAVG